jgi:small Trp-rich protein
LTGASHQPYGPLNGAWLPDYSWFRGTAGVTNMWVLWVAVALLILKLIGMGPFADLSWWWISAVFAVAFVWFDLVEERLGLNKRKAFDEMDEAKQKRIREALERDKSFRRR